MAILVTCGNCGKTLQSKDEWAGKSVRCPGCSEVITVPSLKEKGPPPLPFGEAPSRRPRDDEYEEERPVRRRRSRDDYDDDLPVRRKRRGDSRRGDLSEITEFSVPLAVLLHLLTCGIFTWIWLGLLHGKLPRIRDDDPSAGTAIGFMLIPCFNLYWIFFSYQRLVLRINEQREEVGLEPDLSEAFAIILCISLIIPYVNFIGLLILEPIFLGMVQAKVNELAVAANR